jgi:hypothetical protein
MAVQILFVQNNKGDRTDLIIGPSLPNLMKMRLEEEEEGPENIPFRGKMDAGT